MFTGADDASKIGQINSWNSVNRTNYESTCDWIRGSAGGFYPPSYKSDTLDLFSHQLCRVLSYQSTNITQQHNSLDGVVYQLPETTFANETIKLDRLKSFESWSFK